jgi:DtxR family transcriptional regulator, manganese transport regulator
MTKRRTSAGFARTRSDHANEIAEDYVEAIAGIVAQHQACRLKQLADHFGVTHVTAIKIVKRLERENLVTMEPRGPIALSRAGARLAAHCRKRHEIVRRFLITIGVSERVAAIDSEGIEHHVSPETLKRMRVAATSTWR